MRSMTSWQNIAIRTKLGLSGIMGYRESRGNIARVETYASCRKHASLLSTPWKAPSRSGGPPFGAVVEKLGKLHPLYEGLTLPNRV